jgi:hypothetical protein
MARDAQGQIVVRAVRIEQPIIIDGRLNEVLEVKGGRSEGGWVTEIALPFKSLRYAGSGPQTWGINFRRMVRWKNEVSTLSPVPAALGLPGLARMSTAATLVGLETPAQSMNLEVKPYLLSSLTTNRLTRIQASNETSRRVTNRKPAPSLPTFLSCGLSATSSAAATSA